MINGKKKKILGIVCERSVDLKKHIKNNRLKEKENVAILPMICSGMIQPIMIEEGFKAGADGVFVMGCQINDCHFREGNKWCQDRLLGLRPPNIKKTIDKNKLRGFWLAKCDLISLSSKSLFKKYTNDFFSYRSIFSSKRKRE